MPINTDPNIDKIGGVGPQMDETDQQAVSIHGVLAANADEQSNTMLFIRDTSNNGRVFGIAEWIFNGATWDRHRSNHEVTVLASAARTALINSADLTNYNHAGVVVTVDITAYTAGSLTIALKYKDTLSGKYVALLTSAALAAAATTSLTVYPSIAAVANVAVSMALPRVWRVEVAVGDATSITYSISANYIP